MPIKHALLSLSLFRAMREPSLQDRIGVRAFFVAFFPNARYAAEAEKLLERVGEMKSCARQDIGASSSVAGVRIV